MRGLTAKNKTKKDDVMQWQTQAGNHNTNMKVKINFILPDMVIPHGLIR